MYPKSKQRYVRKPMAATNSVLRLRSKLMSRLRREFESMDFLEVQTPCLVINPGLEPHLIPFSTHYVAQMQQLPIEQWFLPTSPEYHLKKLLARGLNRVFEVAKAFRNGEVGAYHEPEFLMLEWYRAPGTYRDIATDVERLVRILGEELLLLNTPTPWTSQIPVIHWTIQEVFLAFAKVDVQAAIRGGDASEASLAAQCRANDPHKNWPSALDFDTLFHQLLVDQVEPQLPKDALVFLWNYPASQAALARVCKDEPWWAERFETYLFGKEIANAFGELLDANEQRRRCIKDQELRRLLYPGVQPPPLDEEFLAALPKIPDPAAGVAVGLDRLFQVLLGLDRIQDVLSFSKGDL
jgi:lysyl-tRNA synthetase class 2